MLETSHLLQLYNQIVNNSCAQNNLMPIYVETDAKKGYAKIIKIQNFNPIIVKVCQNDQLMGR